MTEQVTTEPVVSPALTDADLEQQALDGRGVRKVIVRAPTPVNIVPA